MDHVAIMNRRLGLIDRILSGHKTIETRWYKNKSAPYDKINVGDAIYFKDSGGYVRARTTVAAVKQFCHLTPVIVRQILNLYGDQIDIQSKQDTSWATNKNYAVLIWLSKVVPTKPFSIDKAGFGSGSAWITVENVDTIRLNPVVAKRLCVGL